MTTEQMDWLDDHDPKWQAKLRGRRGYPMYRCRGCGVWPLVADLVEGRHGHVIHGDMMTPPELCGPVDAIEYRRRSIRPMFAWYDFWIGVFYDKPRRRLYIFPVPCFGVRIEFGGYE